MATSPNPAVDRDLQVVNHALDETSRPAGVGKPKIDFRPDHTGDESVYLVFPNSLKYPLTKQRLKALSAFSMGLQLKLLDTDLERIPYVRFVDAR